MNTIRLREFLVLANVLNYSKAAQILYMSQSVLTRHIQEMEAELGAPVFRRSTHGVALTEMGRVLAREGQSLVDKWDATQSRLRRRNLPAKGSVRIALGLEYSYSSHIRSFFQAFMGRYPNIELKYDVLAGSTPGQVCLNYDVFFTPCTFLNLPSNIHSMLIDQHGTYAVLPPSHPLMSKSAISLHHLTRQTIIVPYANEMFGPYAQNYMFVEKITKGQVASIHVDNLSTALFLVSMGKGICIAPRYVKNMLSADTFLLPISDRNCRFDEYLYYNESDNDAARLFYQEFGEFLNDSTLTEV